MICCVMDNSCLCQDVGGYRYNYGHTDNSNKDKDNLPFHLKPTSKWTINTDSTIKSEIFSNVKVLYDQTTAAQIDMKTTALNAHRNYEPQPKLTGVKPTRRDFVRDVAIGGVKVMRRLIIQERTRLNANWNRKYTLTSEEDLPFTKSTWKFKDSEFDIWQKRHPTRSCTKRKPVSTNRAALKQNSGLSRTCRYSNKSKR